jgi:hypothetical protein
VWATTVEPVVEFAAPPASCLGLEREPRSGVPERNRQRLAEPVIRADAGPVQHLRRGLLEVLAENRLFLAMPVKGKSSKATTSGHAVGACGCQRTGAKTSTQSAAGVPFAL